MTQENKYGALAELDDGVAFVTRLFTAEFARRRLRSVLLNDKATQKQLAEAHRIFLEKMAEIEIYTTDVLTHETAQVALLGVLAHLRQTKIKAEQHKAYVDGMLFSLAPADVLNPFEELGGFEGEER